MPCDDCSRTDNCPPCPHEERDRTESCRCGHIRFLHLREDTDDQHCAHPSCECEGFRPQEPEEPPLTPEEEEQAPEDQAGIYARDPGCETGDVRTCTEACPAHGALEPPPQPAGRPPFAVNYSVQGHLYQVAVPGDASVKAVDGALVIQHHLGPVAGIVQVLPVISEEKG